jgi:hypothetical protein
MSSTAYILVSSFIIIALGIFLTAQENEQMAKFLQFGKSLFSARQTNVHDPASTPSFFERHFTDIKGQPLNMDQLRGNVILLVNTASECGYTPQLHTLQELHDKYKARGFSVLVTIFTCYCRLLFFSSVFSGCTMQ